MCGRVDSLSRCHRKFSTTCCKSDMWYLLPDVVSVWVKANRKWSTKVTNWPRQPKSVAQVSAGLHLCCYGSPLNLSKSSTLELSSNQHKQKYDWNLCFFLSCILLAGAWRAKATYPEEEPRQKEFRKPQGIKSPVNHVWLLFHLHEHLIPLKRNSASLTVPPTRRLIIRACWGIASVSQRLHLSM